MDLVEIKKLLRETSVFSMLSEEELDDVANRCEEVHFTLGKLVCRAGDEADAFYIVADGRARVVAESDSGPDLTVGMLNRGDHFGEQGLLTTSRRQYTIRAGGDLSLLRLSKTVFEEILEARPALRAYFTKYITETSVRNFLKMCTAFAPMSPAEIRDLLGCIQIVEFGPEEAIIREGEEGDAFYVLRSGSARVVKESMGGRILAQLKPGDSFGELALLLGQPRAASIITNDASTVLRLEKADFDRIIASSPKVKDAMITIASGYADTDLRESVAEPQAPVQAPPGAELIEPESEPDDASYRPRRARRYPVLLQVSETDCSAACLAMVLRYYKKHVSITRLRELAHVGREGASLHSVAEAAESLGFHARAVQTTYENLQKVELPAIAHWEGYHYILVYEVRPDRVVVADPAVGLRKMSREEFLKGWTGYLLILTPTPKLEGVEETKTSLGRFLPILKPYRRLLLEIFLASLVLQLFGLATPIFTQVIVDKVLVHQSVSMLNLMLAGMLLIALFQTATMGVRQYLLVHTTRRIDLEMVVTFYNHVLSLPLRYFEQRKVGDILKRFHENATIRELLTGRAIGVVLDGVMVVVYLALMFYYNATLTWVTLAFVPFFVILALVITPILRKQYRESFERNSEAESQLVEAVTAINTIKAMAAERPTRWKWEGLMVRALNVEFRSAITTMLLSASGNVLQNLQRIFLLWFGAHLVIEGRLTVGQLMAFNVLVGNVTGPILSIIDLLDDFQQANIALERLTDVYDTKPEEDLAKKAPIHLPPLRGHIVFQNVTFRYPTRPDKNALQNINLEIHPGQTVALVGRSGAGKTTFASILLRMHAPSEGKVYLDGYDLEQVSLSSLRSQVGVVPQEVTLFSGTIRENIAFGQPNAPLDEVVGAAMLAGAHDFITVLPLGYETVIGERGQSLSGGQRQRIAIARALFKKPRILIFDEATSALDNESERAIQQNLDKILKDRTTFIIAHRLSTVRNADLIVVLDQGVIVETGTHYSLMQQRGLYYYLNSQQLDQ
ncbi:MAG: cyclic nucleotide-binding domain-containing protein [Armatimonadetes bacterium]|nr:cyclic nucleotide-binding domain-containing protein [Armatimonadota bacterium]